MHPGTNFVFVNNIRFLGMLAIIAVHAQFFPWSFTQNSLHAVLLQVFKFGTICFFMISGYLLGSKLQEHGRLTYFKRRLSNTFKPWLIWAAFFFALMLISDIGGGLQLQEILVNFSFVLFHTNYWFIPNFFLALGLLLLMRRWFDQPWFASLLALAAIGYGINLYGQWLPTEHTSALLGFVFYLWLGVKVHANEDKIRSILNRTPYWALWLLIGVTFTAALAEARSLEAHTSDLLNTLRLTNQLYSLSVFALLMKIRRTLSPRWMIVRRHNFGLYLIHWIPLTILFFLLNYGLAQLQGVSGEEFKQNPFIYTSAAQRLAVWIGSFLLIYGGTWALTAWLARGRFASLVGMVPPAARGTPSVSPTGH